MRTDRSLSAQIVGLIRAEAVPAGAHLPAQRLADRLRVSRSPVNQALSLLAAQGVLRREPNRGYFVVAPPADEAAAPEPQDTVSQTYFRIVDDRLRGALPDVFSASLVRQRYALTPAQLSALLGRIAREGWIEKKPGYGWAFSPMLTTADSLLQSLRLRLALEPAALLEPGYRLEPQVIARCRAAETQLLDGGLRTATAEQLHDRGVHFHESLVEGSGNAFFIDAIRRLNRVRRLLSYRSTRDRSRYHEHCGQHLHLLDLLERGRQDDAAAAMREHLSSTLRNLSKITSVLEP